MTRIAIPALIVMLAVAAFVGAAGWNRSGDPWLTVTLTERELPLMQPNVAPGEDPGMQLRIAYDTRNDPLDSRNWIPESRLREIGFAFNVPAGSPQAVDTYDHVPPRIAWVVFEYDGPAWRALEQRRALASPATERPERPALRSRLVPVDAGPDFEALRLRYPSGHIILRGVIGLAYVSADGGGPLLHGVLRELVPPAVAVPHQFGALLEGLTAPSGSGGTEPRYEAELAIGALGLPYIQSLRLRN